MTENPWREMVSGSKRRATLNHEIFWIKEELKGTYGLRICLKTKVAKKIKIGRIKFRSIEIYTANSNSISTDWYLLLKDSEEWEIFYKLCRDLIDQVDKIKKEDDMVFAFVNRLKRWQKLLSEKPSSKFGVELQMGLFSELHTLYYYVADSYNIVDAICAWGGPDSDIQDFLIHNAAIEVKSHRSKRGEVVTISSPNQMYSVKENLNLVVYALNENNKGETIENLITMIKNLLQENALVDELDAFEEKIAQYGYHELIHKNELISFQIDKLSVYSVSENFPRLDVKHIQDGILNIKYQIDLSKCKDHKMDTDNFYNLGR